MSPATVIIFLSILGFIWVFALIAWAVVCTMREAKISEKESSPRTQASD